MLTGTVGEQPGIDCELKSEYRCNGRDNNPVLAIQRPNPEAQSALGVKV